MFWYQFPLNAMRSLTRSISSCCINSHLLPPRKVDVCSVLSEVHWPNDGLDETDVAVAQSSRNSMKIVRPIYNMASQRTLRLWNSAETNHVQFRHSDPQLQLLCDVCWVLQRRSEKVSYMQRTNNRNNAQYKCKISYVGVISITCTWRNSHSGQMLNNTHYVLVLRC